MKLIVPDDRQPSSPPLLAPSSKTISLILEANDHIRFYKGTDIVLARTINYAASGLRDVIMDKIQRVKKQFGNNAEAIVLIKPTADASYKNVVTVLDEMLINDIKKYVLMEPSPEEIAHL